jgi:hypothetical protein
VLNLKQELKILNIYPLEVAKKNHTSVPVISVTLMYVFFWVIPRRVDFIFQRFGTLCLFHLHMRLGMKKFVYLHAYEDGTDRVFRNVGI